MSNHKRPVSCLLCQGAAADPALRRIQVWQNPLWRLTISLEAEVLGFAYLEPKRHIAGISKLAGDEALTFGPVLAKVAGILREEASAESIYIYIFGDDVPHLHLHLAPHRRGDALNDQIIRGELVREPLASGLERVISRQFPLLPEADQRIVAEKVASRLINDGAITDTKSAG